MRALFFGLDGNMFVEAIESFRRAAVPRDVAPFARSMSACDHVESLMNEFSHKLCLGCRTYSDLYDYTSKAWPLLHRTTATSLLILRFPSPSGRILSSTFWKLFLLCENLKQLLESCTSCGCHCWFFSPKSPCYKFGTALPLRKLFHGFRELKQTHHFCPGYLHQCLFQDKMFLHLVGILIPAINKGIWNRCYSLESLQDRKKGEASLVLVCNLPSYLREIITVMIPLLNDHVHSSNINQDLDC